MARREIFRLFPEYKQGFALMQVFVARYAEIDWDAGRSVVIKQGRCPLIPAAIAKRPKSKQSDLPRIEEDEE